MERIQASHRLRQISDQLEATKCSRPEQTEASWPSDMREVPFYPCNPYNQPSKEVKPRPISLVTFPSPPNSPGTFHTPPTSPSTAVPDRKRQVASKTCTSGSEGSVLLQKVQPPKLKQSVHQSVVKPGGSGGVAVQSANQAVVKPGGRGVAVQQPPAVSPLSQTPVQQLAARLPVQQPPAVGLPLTKTNLKLMTVLSNSCTVFTGQVDCDNLITPELPVRKISHDLPYQACSEFDARRDFSKRNAVYKK